jgi:mannosyl-oligosaccharide alpha-1,2-mannosidase
MEMPSNHFTISGMADSTFEYLPKQHLLLGGRMEIYGRMYEKAMEVAEKYLFYTPLTEDGRDILLSGTAYTTNDEDEPVLEPEGQHLACYTGGMLAMGAMIFERPADLDIARRLVEGCVWAYNTLPSGLMPEVFHTVACQKSAAKINANACQWSKEKWYKGIVDKQKDNTETEKMTMDEKAEYWIKEKKLVPGFTDIQDGRYILRWVTHPDLKSRPC